MKITRRQLRRIIREAMRNYPDEFRDEQDDAAHYEQMNDPEFQHKMDTDAWGRQIGVPDMIEWKIAYVDRSTGVTNTTYVEAATEEDAREQMYGVRIRSIEPLETAKTPQETPFIPHEVG